MNAKLSILFYGKKSKLTKEGLLPIYLRVTIEGERIELSTQRYVHKDKWSVESGRVKGNSEEARSVNSYLDILRGRVYDHQRDIVHSGEPLTAAAMHARLLGTDEKKRMLVPIFENHNNQMKSLIGTEYAKGTWDRFETTLDHVKNFLKEKYNTSDLDIRKIDHAFVSDFDFYLRSPHKVEGRTKTLYLRCANNSAVKYIKNLKKIVRICIANGWLEKDPFVNYKGKTKELDRNYCTPAELEAIILKDGLTERLDQVRDIYLAACHTGLAYIDIKQLGIEHISIGIDGGKWITKSRQKTDTASNIPLLPIVEQLLEKYKTHPYCQTTSKLFPVLSNQKMNAYLKELATVCGVRKELTFHSARHTFATTVTLTNDVSIESVSKMLGHKNLRTTQHYAKIVDKKVSNEMQKLGARLNLTQGKLKNA
jgi:site-specific recombinase XerD